MLFHCSYYPILGKGAVGDMPVYSMTLLTLISHFLSFLSFGSFLCKFCIRSVFAFLFCVFSFFLLKLLHFHLRHQGGALLIFLISHRL